MSRTMKDSGIPWIGEIPEKWQLVPSKRLFKGVKRIVGKDVEKYERLALTMQGVIRRNKEDNEGLQPEKFDGYQILEQNNLVFKLIDLQNTKTSRVGLSPYTGIVSPAYIIIANGEKDNRFYYYWFMDMYYRLIFNQMGDDGVRSSLSMADVLSIPIPSISMTEQQTIADFLDKKCTEIDELISLQDKIIEELKAYKQSVITEAVTKGLNPDAPMKDSEIEWMGKIPNTWSVKRLKFIGEGENGLTYSPSDLCGEEGTLVLRSSNIQGSKLVFEDNVYVSCAIPERLWVKKGDIIICSRNGSAALVGKCALVEEDISASFGAFMLRFRTPYFFRYVFYLLSGVISNYKQLFATTTINQLTLGTFNNLYAPFIDNLKEQQAIADYLDKKCSEIDNLISLKQGKIEYLKEYKKSIIYEYTTGKKEVKL